MTTIVETTTAAQPGSANHIWARLVHAVLIAPEQPDQAADLLDALKMHVRTGGSPWAAAAIGTVRGLVHATVGELAAAGSQLARSLGLFYRAGDLPETAWAAEAASVTLRRGGDEEGAAMAAGIAHQCFPEMRLPERDAAWMTSIAPLPEPVPVSSLSATVNDVCKRLAALDSASSTRQSATTGTFRNHGDSWEVAMGGEAKHVRDSKGMHDLAQLLRNPGVPQAAVDLVDAKLVSGSHGPASDRRALREYRSRLAELDERIADAEAFGDADGAENARLEKEAIIDHLSKSYALRGKQRITGDPVEKARSAVTWRIRAAIRNVRAVDERVAEHLDAHVHTGRECVYTPTQPVAWTF